MLDVYVLQFFLNYLVRLRSYTVTYTEEIHRINYRYLVQDLMLISNEKRKLVVYS